MIVTLTLNPSLDRTIEVTELVRGAVLRTRSQRLDAGGKGVNVARVLAANAVKVTAVLPIGGPDGGQLTTLLSSSGIPHTAVAIGAPTRSNVSVVEPDGTVTKLNAPGPELRTGDLEALVQATLDAAADATWVACCGSLPPGTPEDFYARLVRRLGSNGRRVAIDASGAALTHAIAAGADLIKPNRDELAEASEREIATLGDAVDAAAALRGHGASAVLASLGPDGALLVDGAGAVHASCPVDEVRSTVGSGDALLAGLLSVGVMGSDALAEAVAWGAAATALPGTALPGTADVHRDGVVLTSEIPRTQRLEGSH